MNDFGNRAQQYAAFKQQYDNQMKICKTKMLVADAYAEEFGDLGQVYGSIWRKWKTTNNYTIHQIADVIHSIKTNSDSIRHIVSAWYPEDIPTMALPSCHTLFQFYVQDNKLSCQLYQRSADVFLGVPFNIASYALLTELIAHVCGLEPGEFIHTFGDAHIYANHLEQVKTQLDRSIRQAPLLKINKNITNLFDFELHDIELIGYDPHPTIKAPIAV